MFFIDDFNFYRNFYYSIIEIYAMSILFDANKRQKNVNVLIIDFDFYNAQFDDIMRCFQINLKNIDRNYALIINDNDKLV